MIDVVSFVLGFISIFSVLAFGYYLCQNSTKKYIKRHREMNIDDKTIIDLILKE